MPHFTIYLEKRVISVTFSGPSEDFLGQKLEVEFESSTVLMRSPPSIRNLVVRKLQCSWQQLSLLSRHFKVEDSYFPTVSENNNVYKDLELVVNFNIEGLQLLTWSLTGEEKTDEQNLSTALQSDLTTRTHDTGSPISPMEGMEKIASLILHYGVIEYNGGIFPPVTMLNVF